MAYSNWTGNLDIVMASRDAWYDVGELFASVVHIRRANLNTVAARAQAMETLNVTAGFPAGVRSRFPEHRFYIRESDGDWGMKFTQLRAGLQYKNRQVETSDTAPAEKFRSEEDALRSIHAVLDRFLVQLREKYMFIDREEFERKYNLEWA